MGQKAHRAIRLFDGQPLAVVSGGRVGIGGRGRALMRDLRVKRRTEEEARRVAAREAGALDAAAEHQAVTTELQRLGQLLKDRSRDPFDFYKFVDKQGPYKPVPFEPRDYVPAPGVMAVRSVQAYPLTGWLLMAGLGTLAALLSLDSWWRLAGAGAVLLCAGPMGVLQVRRRPDYAARLDAKHRELHAEAQAREAKEHAASEEAKRQARLREEDLRARLRESFGTRSPAPLGELLEHQLRTRPVPLPLILDIDHDGFETGSIDLILPELDDIPEESTSITHSGRLARKRIDRAERAALHEEVCCSLSLRVVHEALRALPMTQRISLRGLHPVRDAAGKEAEKAVLSVSVTRAELDAANLVTGRAPDLVRQLGKWGGSKKGEPAAV